MKAESSLNQLTTSFAFELTWHDKESAGYTDVLLVSAFSEQVESVDTVHDVRGPKGGIAQAFFRLTVKAAEARLEYDIPEFKAVNEKNGMTLGTMTLTFSDSLRTRITSVACGTTSRRVRKRSQSSGRPSWLRPTAYPARRT